MFIIHLEFKFIREWSNTKRVKLPSNLVQGGSQPHYILTNPSRLLGYAEMLILAELLMQFNFSCCWPLRCIGLEQNFTRADIVRIKKYHTASPSVFLLQPCLNILRSAYIWFPFHTVDFNSKWESVIIL